MYGHLRGALDSYRIRDRWTHGASDAAKSFGDRGEAAAFLRRLHLDASGLNTLRRGLSAAALTPAEALTDREVLTRSAERIASGAWQVIEQPQLTPRPAPKPGLNFEVWGLEVNLNVNKKGANATFEGENATTELKIDKKGPHLSIANADGDKRFDADKDGLTLSKTGDDGKKQIKLDKNGNVTLGRSDDDGARQVKVGKDGFSASTKDGDGSRSVSINKNGLTLAKSENGESRGLSVGKNGVQMSSGDGDGRYNVGIGADGKPSGGVHLGDKESGLGISAGPGGVKGSVTVGGITVGHGQDATGGHTTIGNDKHNIEIQKIDDFIDALDGGAIGDVFEDIGDGDFGDAKDKVVAIWDAKPLGKGANQAA